MLNDDHLLRMSDLSSKAEKLSNKRFLVVQGTADEVVHQQHSLWLAKALIHEGVTFRQQVAARVECFSFFVSERLATYNFFVQL